MPNSKYNFENAYFPLVARKMQQNEKKMTKCQTPLDHDIYMCNPTPFIEEKL